MPFVPPEPKWLFSNRNYWYPQNQVTDYATARIRLTVPFEYRVVGSGITEAGSPAAAPAAPIEGSTRVIQRTSYSFVAPQPVRYLGVLVSRMSRVDAATVALDIVPTQAPAPDMRGADTLAAAVIRLNAAVAIPPVGARNTVRAQRRGQPAPGITRPRCARHRRGDPAALFVPHRRRAVRLDHAGDGRRRSAGRPRARATSRCSTTRRRCSGVQLAQRSGVVPGLPRVLHRARARAPVVRPGGGLEELSRAVAERRLRAVLRGALREGEARRGRVPRRAAPVPPLGDRRFRSGPGVSRLSPRPHQGREPRLPRAGLQQGRRGAAHAAAADRRRGVLRRPQAFYAENRFKKAGTDDLRKAMEAASGRDSTASSSAGSTTTASRACATAPPSKARSWSSASSRPATSTTSRSPSAVTYTDGKTAEFVVVGERRRRTKRDSR